MQLTVSAQERQKELPWRLNYCSSPEDTFFKHGLKSRGFATPETSITSQDLAFCDSFLANPYKHAVDRRTKKIVNKENQNPTNTCMKVHIIPD